MAADGGLLQGLRLERRSFQVLFDSTDKREGIRARLEERAARFGAAESAVES